MIFENPFPKEQKIPSTKQKSYLTKNEVKNWVWKDSNLYREVFKSSLSKRNEIWNNFEKHWQTFLGSGSLNKLKLDVLKRKVNRDVYYGETPEKRKSAKELLKFLEALENKFFPS